MHISYDMKDDFSSEDVENIIAEWEKNKDEDVWADRGFYIAGKPYWLRKSMARDTFDLPLIKSENSINLPDLATALRSQRANILNLKSK